MRTATADIGTTTFCDNIPDPISGVYTNNGGNNFCPLCVADITGDGVVGMADLLELLFCYGQLADDCSNPYADIYDDGYINAIDLTYLLGSWGLCP